MKSEKLIRDPKSQRLRREVICEKEALKRMKEQVAELGNALAGDEPFAIVGGYEFQSFILEKSPGRNLVDAGEKFSADENSVYSYPPFGEPLSLKRFIEEFTMSIFTNWLILREEGFSS